MAQKTEYFLKNYLLNFRLRGNKCSACSLRETEQHYRFKITVGDRDITFNIAKTSKLDAPEKYVLINTCKEKIYTPSCCYGAIKTDSHSMLFKSSKDFSVVTYCKDAKGNMEVNIGVNLIDEVFYHLSAIEEYKKESSGINVKPYYSEDVNKLTNDPLVDDFYNLFTDIINAILEKFSVSGGMQRKLDGFNISITHDVDAIKKNYYTTIRYLAFLAATLVRKYDFHAIKRMYRYSSHSSDFDQIINIVHLEKSFGYRSTFFLYSNVAKNNLFSRIVSKVIDPSYDIRGNSVFTDVQDVFNEGGFEVGLHSSYLAARNYEFLEEEFNLLKKLSCNTVTSNRNHFLNFSLTHTPLMLERVGIKCDTTFYYNNVCGFMRHKTCSPFYLYSHPDNRIVDVVEIPTVIMDSTLFNHLGCTDEDAYEKSVKILDKVKERNGIACINWHNETSAPEYGWYSTYRDILKWMRDHGVCAYTIKEVYNRLTSEGYDGRVVNAG